MDQASQVSDISQSGILGNTVRGGVFDNRESERSDTSAAFGKNEYTSRHKDNDVGNRGAPWTIEGQSAPQSDPYDLSFHKRPQQYAWNSVVQGWSRADSGEETPAFLHPSITPIEVSDDRFPHSEFYEYNLQNTPIATRKDDINANRFEMSRLEKIRAPGAFESPSKYVSGRRSPYSEHFYLNDTFDQNIGYFVCVVGIALIGVILLCKKKK